MWTWPALVFCILVRAWGRKIAWNIIAGRDRRDAAVISSTVVIPFIGARIIMIFS